MMLKTRLLLASWVLLLVAVPRVDARPSPMRAAPVAVDVQPYSAFRAPEWEALFDRDSGWTGADGVYSVPLSGDERPGSADATKTFWVFSDTFIGSVDAAGQRVPGAALVNNTNALLTGGVPDPAQMQFFWGAGASGAPAARVVPNTSPSHWFWTNDGIAQNGKIHLYSLRMKPGGSGAFAFAVDGISLLTSQADHTLPFATYTQTVAPLYVAGGGSRGEAYFGVALMPNTATAGAPNPDGYLYIYGVRNDPLGKKLLVARVRPEGIERFADYRFWDGRRWVAGAGKAAPVTDRVSSEFSVTPLPDGRYILVFQLDALSKTIAVRYADSPTGPWGAPVPVWDCPEDTLTADTYTYGAKAHPHLSQPGELLISYHVNTFEFAEHFSDADIYRPRFVRLPLN